MQYQFKKAERKKAKLRLAITGPSGSGKTWGALEIAKGLGGRIAVIDTERGSASLYSHRADFDTLELDAPFVPEKFTNAIKAAEDAGYDVIIIDSTTHEWNGTGGCLELVDELARSKFKGNTWSAWSVVTPRHRAFVDAILHSKAHIISTMRSKTETAQTEKDGRKQVVKLGMKSEQRDGTEYEYTVVLDLSHDGHYAVASKDRTGLFSGDPKPLTVETGEALKGWLESGSDVVEPVNADAVELPEQTQPPKKILSSEDLISQQQALYAAKDLDELKAIFLSAKKLTDDPHQIEIIVAAKDERKKELGAQDVKS